VLNLSYIYRKQNCSLLKKITFLSDVTPPVRCLTVLRYVISVKNFYFGFGSKSESQVWVWMFTFKHPDSAGSRSTVRKWTNVKLEKIGTGNNRTINANLIRLEPFQPGYGSGKLDCTFRKFWIRTNMFETFFGKLKNYKCF
jgi:hypothetical protein